MMDKSMAERTLSAVMDGHEKNKAETFDDGWTGSFLGLFVIFQKTFGLIELK